MRFDQDIANVRERIDRAVFDRDHWRTAGRQEKYLEAYSMVEALELELDLLRREKFAAAASSERLSPIDSPPAAKADSLETTDAGDRGRLMAAFSITFSGRQYQYSQYRYDRLNDAVAYARRQIQAPSAIDAGDSLPPARVVEAPDAAQRKQMAGFDISFKEGVYRLGPYRYDRLADAIGYARVQEVFHAFPGSIRNPRPKASLS
jgi:hypothetical protein